MSEEDTERDRSNPEQIEIMSETETAKPGAGLNQASSPEQTPAAQTKPAKRGGGLALILALLALGIMALPAYDYYRLLLANTSYVTDSSVSNLERQLSSLERQTNSLKRQSSSLEQQVNASFNIERLSQESVQAMIDESSRQFEQALTDIDNLQEQVNRSLGTKQARAERANYANRILLMEAEHLLRQANGRVLMASDPASALEMLGQADSLIRGVTDIPEQAVHALREALASEMAALRATPSVDVQGIYLELSALKGQVADLKRNILDIMPDQSMIDASSPQNAAGSYLDRILNLVDFRQGQVEIQPILPPREDYYLRQNLLLHLQIAQMAVLAGNQDVFDQSLTEAEDWLGDGFDLQQPTAASMAEALERLQAKQIAVKMPDLSASLLQVRKLLKTQAQSAAGPA